MITKTAAQKAGRKEDKEKRDNVMALKCLTMGCNEQWTEHERGEVTHVLWAV